MLSETTPGGGVADTRLSNYASNVPGSSWDLKRTDEYRLKSESQYKS